MRNFIFTLFFIITLFIVGPSTVSAQIQFFDYSGNNPESYQCFDKEGRILREGSSNWPKDESGNLVPVDQLIYKDDITGYFLCRGVDNDGIVGDDRAILIPPTLQQLEVWFVRILYVVWAAVGSLSFLLLVGVGYEYMIRGGTSDQELVKLRKRIINYVIGFALVFLAVPILTSVFNLLGINDDVDCYNVNMPGFQFFFTDLCTGTEARLRIACETGQPLQEGLACGSVGQQVTCVSLLGDETPIASINRSFYCSVIAEKNTWLDSEYYQN